MCEGEEQGGRGGAELREGPTRLTRCNRPRDPRHQAHPESNRWRVWHAAATALPPPLPHTPEPSLPTTLLPNAPRVKAVEADAP